MERLTERERNVDGTGIAKEEIMDGLSNGEIHTKINVVRAEMSLPGGVFIRK